MLTDFTKGFDRFDHSLLLSFFYKSGFGVPIFTYTLLNYLEDNWVKIERLIASGVSLKV